MALVGTFDCSIKIIIWLLDWSNLTLLLDVTKTRNGLESGLANGLSQFL